MQTSLFLAIAAVLLVAHFSGAVIGHWLGRRRGAIDADELRAYRAALGFIEGVAPSAVMLTSGEWDTDDDGADDELAELFGFDAVFDMDTWELADAADPIEEAADAETDEKPDGDDDADYIPELSQPRRRFRRRRTDEPATTVIAVPVGTEQLLLTIHN